MRQLLKHDVMYGIVNQWKFFLLGCVMVLVFCYYTYTGIAESYAYGSCSTMGTLMDYFLAIFKGMEEYELTRTSIFKIPTMWLAMGIILAYIIGYYAEKDLKTYGVYSLMATKSRTKWWLSKCIWCVGSVLLYFLLFVIVIAITVKAVGGTLSLDYTLQIAQSANVRAVYLTRGYATAMMVIVEPLVMICALSLLQMTCSVIFGSIASFSGMCILYILSLFRNSPVLPVNYLMWVRNDSVLLDHGCNTLVGMIYAMIIILASLIIGIVYMERHDILSKE